MKTILFAFVSLFSMSLFGLTLGDQISEGQEGSFIVLEGEGTVFLLHICKKDEERLVVEEVSMPSVSLPKYLCESQNKRLWKDWFINEAKKTCTWQVFFIDRNVFEKTAAFSVKNGALFPSPIDRSFFARCFALDLIRVPISEQPSTGIRATGLRDTEGSGVWLPPHVKNGEKIRSQSVVYSAEWADDGSRLSQKKMIFYFDLDRRDYPFPYWIQVYEKGVRKKIKEIDSGQGLYSPFFSLYFNKLQINTH